MGKGRLEAFTDGVVAIIITIMVLELKVPHGTSLRDLAPMAPTFLCYGLSFIYVGIYWNNHHHMLQAARSVNGPILWANMHLLFWLSLSPLFYITAIVSTFIVPWVAQALYVAVALVWLVPDRRIENALGMRGRP